MSEKFNFNISLSVLNHLGRNLYRNIITVLGEAISNSWDADAKNIWIKIDKQSNTMCILDDGVGMNSEDFQNKFLKIGYSKRNNGNYKSNFGRQYIGRKGIGKLALLSCAERIHIATRCEGGEIVGGIIDNTGLDNAIKDDVNSQDYTLDMLEKDFSSDFSRVSHGTLILFESVTNGIFNTVEYIKKAIALSFRFSLIDSDFNIYVNDTKIDETLLVDFAQNTQFLWNINGMDDPLISMMSNLSENVNIESKLSIKGYIASAKKPSNIRIRGTQEKASNGPFVNGRLREKDILPHTHTTRIVESYVYGQIHFDALDQGNNKDVFTSSREGIVSNDPTFENFLNDFEKMFRMIIDQWDDFRRKHGEDGDPDNTKISPKERKAQELFNVTIKDIDINDEFVNKGTIIDEWARELSEEAQFNIPSYTECFISENLLRKYIKYRSIPLSDEATREANQWRDKESRNKEAANISYDVRAALNDLFYLDMAYLSNLIDKVPNNSPKIAGLSRSAVVYKPMRDAVGHTSLLTPTAKQQLNIEYENIKARLANLLKDVADKNNNSN